MTYKMVALDIDGTLLNSEGKIPDLHKQIIQRAHNDGVYIVLATGRYFMQAKPIMDELNYEGILISNDGAVSIDGKTYEVVCENSFLIDDVSHFIKACRKEKVQFAMITAFNYYVESISQNHKENCNQYGIKYTSCEDVLTLSEKVMKFSIMDTSKIGGWQHLEVPKTLRLRVDSEFWKEYMLKQATKTSAIKEIANKLSIDSSEIIAIGDQFNDLDMIEYAGMGIAMGNAPKDVKDKANDVTLSNDENGVYHALNKYLFN
ncbi:Cof-type HAD-IIB family hydrolase [Lederbergia citri]|uniref:HAD family phosphatase n=1 Tax=Lederbergia citri TaxID=2833580 RepID=A0A942TAI4_9BACI|nr:Cof-type HAD-IIB family hydrolase [Lederbergia citri]MBS4194145.1 HAD family phosphatase [Lederbergia citri]